MKTIKNIDEEIKYLKQMVRMAREEYGVKYGCAGSYRKENKDPDRFSVCLECLIDEQARVIKELRKLIKTTKGS